MSSVRRLCGGATTLCSSCSPEHLLCIHSWSKVTTHPREYRENVAAAWLLLINLLLYYLNHCVPVTSSFTNRREMTQENQVDLKVVH